MISPTVQAGLINYELQSLGWKAFQDLCATIVADIWGQTIQTFCDSHDGGRDGAFQGTWQPNKTESFSGTFTVQCKFTSKKDDHIQLSDLTEEVSKANRLASKGLADNYFLFTNYLLTGISEEAISTAFTSIPGVHRFAAYGHERISQFIKESSRLRMLVPRVYGLGDLSQILDARAYDQAKDILSALGDDLSKFIITNPHRKSVKAIQEHGFVLLLGEPACGKSSIAASLAVGAIDQWGCAAIKIRNADDFIRHWNPHESKQFFWVDDVFGSTQLEVDNTISWNKAFPHVQAALKKGAKVIFTSRSYIFNAAKAFLKETAFPLIKESQVVINVAELTSSEKEQILYNHIKLGDQTVSYKQSIRQFLKDIVDNPNFSPEIARRLGNSLFTKELPLMPYYLKNFVDNPLNFLCDVIRTLDVQSRSALCLVFMRSGFLSSPIEISDAESSALERLGGRRNEAVKAFQPLNNSLLLYASSGGFSYWKFKHPTIRDAFATLVMEDLELLDIYLVGTPIERLFQEISCGPVNITGIKVIIPVKRYETVRCRLNSYMRAKDYSKTGLHRFLAYRCDKVFLEQFILAHPLFVDGLQVGSYLYAVSDVDVIARLHEFSLLPAVKRIEVVTAMRELAVETPDAGFLDNTLRTLFTSDELAETLACVRDRLIKNINKTIEYWRERYREEDDEPESYFRELKDAFDSYKKEFP